MAVALVRPLLAVNRVQAPVLKLSAPTPAPAPAYDVVKSVPEVHACGGRCGSLPSSGVAPAAGAAPSLSLTTVGSSLLPPPAGQVPAEDSATQVGAWLQENGGLWLWVIIAIVLIVVLSPGPGRRSSW